MELQASVGVFTIGNRMSRQGKKMPRMVARDSDGQPAALNGEAAASSDSAQSAPIAATPPSGRSAVDAENFDAWLSDELARLYGSALSEPLPDDMLRLLHEAARRR
jgi:hypothetical protein